VPQQSTIDADIAANMKALGIAALPVSRQTIVYDTLVRLCRETGQVPGLSEVQKACGLTRSQVSTAMRHLASIGKVHMIGEQHSGHYLPKVV
jgi:hypothetical protein